MLSFLKRTNEDFHMKIYTFEQKVQSINLSLLKKNQLNYDFEVNFLSKKMKQGLLDTFDQPLSGNVDFHRFF